MNDKLPNKPEPAQVLLYQAEDGQTRLEVAFRGETCWLSLNQLAELFQRDKSVISRHIKNLFEEGELMREATVAKFATVQTEGTKTVHRQIEFIVKGFAMGDDLLAGKAHVTPFLTESQEGGT